MDCQKIGRKLTEIQQGARRPRLGSSWFVEPRTEHIQVLAVINIAPRFTQSFADEHKRHAAGSGGGFRLAAVPRYAQK